MNKERNETFGMVSDQDTDRASPLTVWGGTMLVAAVLGLILLTSIGTGGQALGGIPGLGRAVMFAIVQWLG